MGFTLFTVSTTAKSAFEKKLTDCVTQAFADLGPNTRAVMKPARNETLEAGDHPRSGSVIPNHDLIADLARRIEISYRLRCSLWCEGCSTARVWDRAAHYLWQAHEESQERVPLDPELYVASQDVTSRFANPWF